MAQPMQQKEFDIHDPNAVLTKLGQLRMALRQLDDEVTGLIYIAVNQLQNEQREKAVQEALGKNLKDIEKTGKQ